MAENRTSKRGELVMDRWFALAANSGGGSPNTATSPPELDVWIGDAVDSTFTLELTGVGAACSATTGPAITAECAVAVSDLDSAYKQVATLVSRVDRKRYSVTVVLGENNADLGSNYPRGSMRIKLTNTDAVNACFVRVRMWANLTRGDGSHIAAVPAGPILPPAGGPAPFLWADKVIYLDGAGGPGTTKWAMSAADVLPMRERTFAAYTVDFAASGTGTAVADFQRTAMPTERDGAWENMLPSAAALAAGSGFVNKSFAADGTSTLAPRGYQRVQFRNTHATDAVVIRARVWAHLSGS